MQILTKLLCEDCGVSCDLFIVNTEEEREKGKCMFEEYNLCKSCIQKRESEEDKNE